MFKYGTEASGGMSSETNGRRDVTEGDSAAADEPAAQAETERLAERLTAVERAVANDGEPGPWTGADTDDATPEEVDAIAERIEAVEERVERLEAATQALRGYTGAVRAVNREVERRADLALERATEGEPGSREAAPTDGKRPTNSPRERGCEVPDDTALDAAVPDAPASGEGGPGTAGRDRDGEADAGALERLRDAL